MTWIAAVSAAFFPLLRYADQRSQLGLSRPGLVMMPGGRISLALAVHPRCACSRASLAELRRLVTLAYRPVDVTIFFLQSSAEDPELVTMAKAIPGAHLERSLSPARVRRLGALTSGELFVFDEQGAVTFHGGLIAAPSDRSDRRQTMALAAVRGEHTHTLSAPGFLSALASTP